MQFNAPKNFNRGSLIMGRFRLIDLLILIAGSLFTFVSMIVYVGMINGRSVPLALLLFLPAAVCYILTMPCGIYHNNLVFIRMWLGFGKKQKSYLWEGIYSYDSFEELEEKYSE